MNLRLFLLIFYFSYTQSCPQSVKTLCQCQLWFSGLHLDCSYLNFTEVVSVLQKENSPIQKLILRHTEIPILEKDAFGSLLIKQLELADNNMTKIKSGAFDGQAAVLQELSVTNNLVSVFPKLGNMPELTSVDLSRNMLSTIPERAFTNTPNLKQLRLEDNKICTMTRLALDETKQFLELLDLSGNCFKLIPAQNFRGAQKLTYLDMSDNMLPELPNLQFMNLPLLKEVRLNGNKISRLWPLAFMNVPNLQHLYLRDNTLSELEPNRFQGFQKLELLDLTGNSIKKIKSSTFKEVMSLKQLFLDDNQIESVETLAFSSNPKLQMISMQNNDINALYRNAFESCPQMIILLLANNSLESIGGGVFEGMKNLQQLNLRNNKINTIELGAFNAVPQLTTLDLGQNDLTTIPKTTFNNLRKLFWCDLCCNNIETFEKGTFTTKVANILIHENPLQCNESLDWFVQYLVANNVRTFLPNQKDITCTGPPEYAGVRLKELMIKKANETFFKTFNNLVPGGASVTNPGPILGSLLPNLNGLLPNSAGGIPGLNAAIPGFSTVTQFTKHIPGLGGLNLLSGGLGPGGFKSDENPTAASQGLAVDSFVRPLSRFMTGNQPLATDVSDLVGSIPNLVSQLPQAPGGIDVSKLSPELIKHVLNGGQIPGIPKATLDGMVKNYMQQLARAAQAANAGTATEATTAALPPITDLPKELITQVISGDPLPGLTTAETEAIKAHYAKQLTSPASPSVITGIPAEELIKRLPADFDLGRLPSEILQQVANGETPDLSLLPADIIEELKLANPDLAAQLETNSIVPKSSKNILDRLPPTQDIVQPTYQPYSIADLDRQSEIDVKEDNSKVALYTAIGLAAVGVLTVLVVAYFCYRRRTQNNNPGQEQAKFFGPVSSSPKSFDSLVPPQAAPPTVPQHYNIQQQGHYMTPTNHQQAPALSPIAQFDPYTIRQPAWAYSGYGTPGPDYRRTEM